MDNTEIIKSVWKDDFFVLFMKKRFPNEQSKGYIKEWKERLKTGNPFVWMDEKTLKAYIEAVKEIYK